MIKKTFFSMILILCCFSVTFAADISGEWISYVESPEGSMEFLFTFEVDGSTLTGTISSEFGDAHLC